MEAVRAAEQALVDLGVGEEHTYARAYEVLAECAGDVRRPGRPPAGRRVLQHRRGGVGGMRRVRPGPGVPPRPGDGRARPARAPRRGTRPARPAPGDGRPVRRRTFLDGADRGLRAVQRQPPRERRRPVRPGHRRRVRARQPPADRRRGVGSGAGRGPPRRRRQHAALGRDGREHGADRCRRRARRPLPLRHRHRARRARRDRRSRRGTSTRALDRRSVFPDQVASTTFLLEARLGRARRRRRALRSTPPAEWWRVQLVAAHAAARQGDLDRAQRLLADSERELVALGFSSATALGEGRTHSELQAMLQRAPAPAEPTARRPRDGGAGTGAAHRLRVIGGAMVVEDGDARRARSRRATRSASSAWSSPTADRPRSTSSARRCGRARTST